MDDSVHDWQGCKGCALHHINHHQALQLCELLRGRATGSAFMVLICTLLIIRTSTTTLLADSIQVVYEINDTAIGIKIQFIIFCN